jgi:protein ImuB
MGRRLCIWFPNWPIQRIQNQKLLSSIVQDSEFLPASSQPYDQSDFREDDVEENHQCDFAERKPLVIWDEYPRRGRLVVAACSMSQELGVRMQMPVSHAVELLQQGLASLAPSRRKSTCAAASAAVSVRRKSFPNRQSRSSFLLMQRDVPTDDQALGRLAKLIQHRITPSVAIESLEVKKWAGVSRYQRESLLCDVTGVSHLYGGEAGLCHAAAILLSQYGLACRIAVADTVATAWAFARFGWMNSSTSICVASGIAGEAMRDQLPVQSLRIFPESYKNLKRLGVDRVGQLLALPRSGLVSRFGKHLVLQISRIIGERDEPLAVYCPPSENRSSLSLEYPTRDLPLLQDRVHRLVSQVCTALSVSQHGVLRLLLKLDLVEHPCHRCEVGLFAPTVDVAQIAGLVNQHLESARLPGLVQEMELTATLTGPLRMVQNDLFESTDAESWADGVSDGELNRFVNALSGRLGKQAVVSVSPTRNPLPEDAFRTTSLEGLQQKKIGSRFTDRVKKSKPPVSGQNSLSASASSVSGSFLTSRCYSQGSLSQSAGQSCGGHHAMQGDGGDESFDRESFERDADLTFRQPSPDDPMRRPTFLLTKPVRLLVAISNEGFTYRCQSNVLPGQIQLAGRVYSIVESWGPERIETGWWKGPCIRRDYYRVELDDGQWWWIFRQFPAAESVDRRSSWMLHGYFD